ncbi:MAG: hypothetical protein COB69_02295 [Phycisphaera sp.]|nr:MAG: hypothetical protein COB69_02295 [Phycisphaera sp.]
MSTLSTAPFTAGVDYRDNPRQHAIYQLRNTPTRHYPFEHIVLNDVFPADYYQDLIDNLPADDAYTAAENGKYPERGRLMLSTHEQDGSQDDLANLPDNAREFWTHFRDHVINQNFWGALVEAFAPTLTSRFLDTCWLQSFLSRDRGGYAISPHTDTSKKLISVLFYLPTSEAVLDCGTSIVVSNQPKHNTFNVPHSGNWDGFDIAHTVPFAPNSMLGFLVSDTSLHAVKPTPPGTARDTIQFNVMMPE